MDERGDETRWAAHAGLARALRAAVFLAPVAASIGAAWLVQGQLPRADGLGELSWHLLVLLAVSSAVLVGVDRLGRRALPLATLLELTMLFPDRAPSRLGVARDAIRRRSVEEQLERVREAGADPVVAAREILALVAALRAHDRPTRGHAERVRMFTDLIAEEMGVVARDRDLLRWAAILHDIGKLRVDAALLNKPGKPTDAEWALLRAHPEHGAEMAGALLPWLGEWGQVILQHHERYDGTGYPAGLAGRQISFGGRIVAVADAFDVMTAARAYRRPVSRAAAHRELVRWSGTQFDPAVVRAMVGMSAPRLRRAQGVVAWLGDLPVVASGSVPVATLARVVGAGALASGAAAGVATPAPPLEVASVHSVAAESRAAADEATHAVSSAKPAMSRVARTPGTTPVAPAPSPGVAGAPEGSARAAADGTPGSAPTPDPTPRQSADDVPIPTQRPAVSTAVSPRPVTGHPTKASTPHPPRRPTAAGPVVGTVTRAAGSVVGGVTPSVDNTVGGVTGAVDGTVGAVAGAVTGGVGGTAGGVTGTVDGTVGTVTGTVNGTTGAVTGAVTGTTGGVLKKLGDVLGR